jgi:phage I-like protein
MNDTPRWFWGDSDYAQAFAWIVNPERKSQSKEEHFARLFGAYCAAIERLDARRGTLIRYESLPDAVWRVLSPHFSLSVDATLRQRMAEASRLHAKRPPEAPQTEFVPDAAIKRAGASQALVEAVNVFSRPALQRLFTRFSAAS